MFTVCFISEGKRIGFNKFWSEEKALKAGERWIGNGLYDRAYTIEEIKGGHGK